LDDLHASSGAPEHFCELGMRGRYGSLARLLSHREAVRADDRDIGDADEIEDQSPERWAGGSAPRSRYMTVTAGSASRHCSTSAADSRRETEWSASTLESMCSSVVGRDD